MMVSEETYLTQRACRLSPGTVVRQRPSAAKSGSATKTSRQNKRAASLTYCSFMVMCPFEFMTRRE